MVKTMVASHVGSHLYDHFPTLTVSLFAASFHKNGHWPPSFRGDGVHPFFTGRKRFAVRGEKESRRRPLGEPMVLHVERLPAGTIPLVRVTIDRRTDKVFGIAFFGNVRLRKYGICEHVSVVLQPAHAPSFPNSFQSESNPPSSRLTTRLWTIIQEISAVLNGNRRAQ